MVNRIIRRVFGPPTPARGAHSDNVQLPCPVGCPIAHRLGTPPPPVLCGGHIDDQHRLVNRDLVCVLAVGFWSFKMQFKCGKGALPQTVKQ